MPDIVRFEGVTKRFGRIVALDNVSLSLPASRIIGLIGTNSSGKSTLLRHIVGLYLPTHGACYTFGHPARLLGPDDLARIGMVHQHEGFFLWMNVAEILAYVSSFYRHWDAQLQRRLMHTFELAPADKVADLSPGKKQRLAIVLAACHHPELLLLDEPLSDLDPIARERMLELLLDVFRNDGTTIIISSHMLHDIERIMNHVLCLDTGRIVFDEPLDTLLERFSEWTVTSGTGWLPARFEEAWIVSQSGDQRRRILLVEHATRELHEFSARHHVTVEAKPLNLHRIFASVVGPLHPARTVPGGADHSVMQPSDAL